MVGVIGGFDELRDSDGNLLGPLGVGVDPDWEVIDRQVITASVATVDMVIDDVTLWDEYELTILNAHPATDSVAGWLRFSTDGGATFITTTTYNWGGARWDTTGGATAQGSSADDRINLVGATSVGNAAGEHLNSIVRFNELGNTSDHKSCHYDSHMVNTGTNTQGAYGTGSLESTSAVDAIRFLFSSGNIERGTFVLRGRRKAPAEILVNEDWEVIHDDVSPTAAATHDFFWANGIYDEIEIVITNARLGTDAQNLELRLSSDGSTFHSGASDYKTAFHNFNDLGGGGGNATESSNGATTVNLVADMGTGTDEYMSGEIRIFGVSNTTQKTKGMSRFSGIISDATLQDMGTTFIDMNTNDAIQGVQLRGQGSTTVTWDRCRIRGRRVTPRGGNVTGSGGGDLQHLGDFTVATPGDTFIDVDMRSSVNPQFTEDFQDTDFIVFISGQIGPSNATVFFRVVLNGVQQSGGSDYKSDNSNSTSSIRLSPSTPGAGRKFVCRVFLYNYNNSANTAFYGITADSFSADSGGTREPLGNASGHGNALAAGLNNGFRIGLSAGDADDITVSVYGFKRSQNA